jgi:hypothetical protein
MNKYIQKIYESYLTMKNKVTVEYLDCFEHELSEVDLLYIDPDIIINTLLYMYYQNKLFLITNNLWIIKMKDHHIVLVNTEDYSGRGDKNYILISFSLFTILIEQKSNYNYFKNGNMNVLTKLEGMNPFNFYIHKFFYFLFKPFGTVVLTNFEELLLSKVIKEPVLRSNVHQFVVNSVTII